MTCTRCQGTGFLNIDHLSEEHAKILGEIGPECFVDYCVSKELFNEVYPDLSVCDCCGDMECWYGIPGEHYSRNDPEGTPGPYAYNGGRCECH